MPLQSAPFLMIDEVHCSLMQETKDESWKNLYQSTMVYVRKMLFRMNMPASWKGQETEIAEDIVQETMFRIVKYLQQVAHGEKEVPHSLTALALTIAKHCLLDLRRRDARLCPMDSDAASAKEFEQEQTTALDQAIDNIETKHLLYQAAATVARFPDKQRRAVLADLAGSMHFERKQTALQQAFSAVGIQIQDYKYTRPADPAERSRQASLRSLAYKRIARELSPW